MLLIGIDEAGYGPLLGPLCHGYCALRVPDAAAEKRPPDLWKILAPTISRFPAEGDALAIDDSKRVYGASDGFEQLLRGVSAFLPGDATHCLKSLLDAGERDALETEPWGRGDDAPRAVAHTLLAETLARAGAEILAVGARAMPASQFNRALGGGANKADINAGRMCECLARLLTLARPGEPVAAVIDRLGGRKFYGDCLQPLFPGEMIWIDAEAKLVSSYRIECRGAAVRVDFRVGAETEWMPVALASMAAKLTRELCMERFNAFFRAHDETLLPTAGYTTDARRFLQDTVRLRKQLNIDDQVLIRAK